MWWFLKKSRPVETKTDSERSLAEEGLLAHVPDPPMVESDVAVKVWLPEAVAQTLKWVADYEGVSQSAWTRDRLAAYVYGEVAVLAWKIRKERNAFLEDRLFSRSPVDRESGRWIYKVPQLGKNTVAFKVWVGQQLRDDLELLAQHAGIGLSPFIREALIGQLLGRGSLPERPEILGAATAEAQAWERGEDVPYNYLEETSFNGLGESEMAWVPDEPGDDAAA